MVGDKHGLGREQVLDHGSGRVLGMGMGSEDVSLVFIAVIAVIALSE
jgi:hypothetical protein